MIFKYINKMSLNFLNTYERYIDNYDSPPRQPPLKRKQAMSRIPCFIAVSPMQLLSRHNARFEDNVIS